MKVALSEFAAGVVTVEQMPGLPVGWEEGREGGRGGGRGKSEREKSAPREGRAGLCGCERVCE
jgi:hypothetical protein